MSHALLTPTHMAAPRRYVRKRPFLERLLDMLRNGPWEVVIFTASVRAYADKLLDVLGA